MSPKNTKKAPFRCHDSLLLKNEALGGRAARAAGVLSSHCDPHSVNLAANDSVGVENTPALPLVCSDALSCRGLLPDAPLVSGDEIMFMPGGVHEITPSQGGKSLRVQVLCNPEGAAAIERQRAAMVAKGVRPYFDLNHDDQEASFWPTSFYWKDGPAPGIYARGEWSSAGLTARDGKTFRQFSPVFFVDDTSRRPARIICNQDAGPNMGGLVNNPAFKKILPIWAKNAAESSTTQKTDTMNEQEIAALRAKNTELETEVARLTSEQQALKAKNENDTVIASEIRAKTAELEAGKAKLELESILAKNRDLEAANKKRAEADADRAIEEAVARGAIAAKDEETKKQWKGMILADPSAAALLAKQAGNTALSGSRHAEGAGRIQAGNEDPGNVMKAMGAIVAKSKIASLITDKTQLSRELAAIYAKEFKGDNSERMLNLPLSAAAALMAADSTDSNLGTLAGSLVTMRTLELLHFVFPGLTNFTSDFSDQAAQFNQTIITRTIGIPAVSSYDTSTGWASSTDTTTDVPVTINQHKGVPITFDSNILAATMRRLFDEIAPAQAYALGKDMMDALYSNITDANFTNNTVVATSSFARTSIVSVGTQLDLRGVPNGPGMRTGLLYPTVFEKLKNDSTLLTLAAYQKPELITGGATAAGAYGIPVDSVTCYTAPNLPTNNGNVTGFVGSKSALVIATRVPSDYTAALPGSSYGNVTVVTNPNTGISVLLVQYVDHKLGTANQRVQVMYGTAPGQGAAGQLIKAAAGTGSSR